MGAPLLELKSVRACYGEAVVLEDISLEVSEGDSLAVLGRNGVGKTTLLLTIMGFTDVIRGSILWRGKDITRLSSHKRARMGLGWVAQERCIFPSLTVEENLTVTARPGRWTLKAAYDLFPRLAERSAAMGNHLSGGEQQMLAVARSLMTNPLLLLLDEPMEGLAPIIVEEIERAVARMTRDEGTTVILVEQHAEIALALMSRALVLERGVIVHRSSSSELLQNAALLDRLIGLKLKES